MTGLVHTYWHCDVGGVVVQSALLNSSPAVGRHPARSCLTVFMVWAINVPPVMVCTAAQTAHCPRNCLLRSCAGS